MKLWRDSSLRYWQYYKSLTLQGKWFCWFHYSKVLISPHHVWLICSTSLAHMWRLLWIHDDIDRNGKWKPIQHLCDLLLWNTVLVPPKGETSVWTLLNSTDRESERFPKRNQNIAPWWRAPAKVIILSSKIQKLNPQSVPHSFFNILYQADVCFYKYSFFLFKTLFHATNRGKNVKTGDDS